MESEASSPRSVMRLLGIFEAIAAAPDGLSLAELSVSLSSPKSTLLTMLRPLVARGHLLHGGGRYRLGPTIFRFASDILARRRFPQLIRAIMEDLVVRSQETVFLAAIDRVAGIATYVEGIDSPQAVRYSVPAGTTRPLFCSAAGLALLAYQDPAWRRDYIAAADLRAMTDRTITDKGLLETRITEIRDARISVSLGEAITDAGGIAAPIGEPGGSVAMCLLLAGPVARIKERLATLVPMVRDAAARATSAMGGHQEIEPPPAPEAKASPKRRTSRAS